MTDQPKHVCQDCGRQDETVNKHQIRTENVKDKVLGKKDDVFVFPYLCDECLKKYAQ